VTVLLLDCYQSTEICQNNHDFGLYHDVWYTDSTSGSVA